MGEDMYAQPQGITVATAITISRALTMCQTVCFLLCISFLTEA